MITRKTFVWLTNRSHRAFLDFLFPIGGTLNKARTEIEDYLRACDAFRRAIPPDGVAHHSVGCGQKDAFNQPLPCPKCLQARATAHLGMLGKSMWRRYHAWECACNKAGKACVKGAGNCTVCLADYSAWEKQIFNIPVHG